MAEQIPDEIMREAKEIANRAAAHVRNNADAEAVVNIVTRMAIDALLDRDKRAAEIARRHPGVNFTDARGYLDWRLPSKHDIATAILTYEGSPAKEEMS